MENQILYLVLAWLYMLDSYILIIFIAALTLALLGMVIQKEKNSNIGRIIKRISLIVFFMGIMCLGIVNADVRSYVTHTEKKADRYFEYSENLLDKKIKVMVNNKCYSVNSGDITTEFTFADKKHKAGTTEMLVRLPEIKKNTPKYARKVTEAKVKYEKIKLKRIIYK